MLFITNLFLFVFIYVFIYSFIFCNKILQMYNLGENIAAVFIMW